MAHARAQRGRWQISQIAPASPSTLTSKKNPAYTFLFLHDNDGGPAAGQHHVVLATSEKLEIRAPYRVSAIGHFILEHDASDDKVRLLAQADTTVLRAAPLLTSATETSLPMISADSPASRLATRLLFLVAGFGYACWAPLVPYTKSQLTLDDHILGFLFLCIGIGSICAMVLTGPITARYGSKPVIIGAGFGFAGALALLPLAASPLALGCYLALFGATLGALDVAMNLHAVEVERAAQQPLMSGFHALFSIGGFAGSAVMTLLLSKQLAQLPSTLMCASLMVVAMSFAVPRLLSGSEKKSGPIFVLPRGLVLLIAQLAGITFLVEGALLDWGALLLTEQGLFPQAQGGMGYIVFSLTMTAGRLSGDAIASRIGDRKTMLWGGLLALTGFGVLLTASSGTWALAGFALIGLGCSNIVPVLFRRAASQASMPPALAVAAISTIGYAGILAGPAGIGFVAKAVSLPAAFWLLAGLLALVPLLAHRITRPAA